MHMDVTELISITFDPYSAGDLLTDLLLILADTALCERALLMCSHIAHVIITAIQATTHSLQYGNLVLIVFNSFQVFDLEQVGNW